MGGHHASLAYSAAAPVATGYSQVSPSASLTIAGAAPAAVPAFGGRNYAGAGRYVANSAGTVHVAKREAEADPYVLGYGGLGYTGVGYAGVGYHGLGYHGLCYTAAAPVVTAAAHVATAPVVTAAPVATGSSQVSPSASLPIAGAAPAAVPAVGGRNYAGAGRYVANSAGTVHVAKREADPYVLGYGGLGYAG